MVAEGWRWAGVLPSSPTDPGYSSSPVLGPAPFRAEGCDAEGVPPASYCWRFPDRTAATASNFTGAIELTIDSRFNWRRLPPQTRLGAVCHLYQCVVAQRGAMRVLAADRTLILEFFNRDGLIHP